MRSTRSPARARTPPSPGTWAARACSRPCSRSSRARSATCRPRAAASTPSRSCGAFDGLDKYIQRRTDNSALGFGSNLKDTSSEAQKALLRKVEPHDLVKFGLIPELIGRLPVITVLDDLDEDTLVRVLKEPKNSLVKQYKALMGMDNVDLVFTDEALRAIARKTIERKTGARGLRSVMEELLIPIMYAVPSDPTIIRVTIDQDTVEGGEAHMEYGAVRKRYKNQIAVS